MSSIGVALIGGGIWAREEHLPAILACPGLSLKAIFSRSLKSAQETARLVPEDGPKPDLYSTDSGTDKGYRDLLQREDVQAVIVSLPIMDGPGYIEAALTAGKHVLAEKPIAHDVARALDLLKFYSEIRREKDVTLAIAENWRLHPCMVYAKEESKKLGKPTGFKASVFFMMREGNKFLETGWRKTPSHQGGFVLDSGTHFVAPIRNILGRENLLDTLMAYTSQVQAHLPPLDTVHAVLRTKTGVVGSFSMSVGTTMSGVSWDFAFENGSMTLSPTSVTVRTEVGEETKEFSPSSGVPEEVAAWAKALAEGTPNELQSPEEGLGDLEFLEKMFRSGDQDGAPQKLTFQ